MMVRPAADEAGDFHFRYINQVPDGEIRGLLQAQLTEALADFERVSEERSAYRYAPDKWSIREVVAHMSDTERVFAYRALWFARGFDTPLPGFDQDVAAASAGAHDRSWRSLVGEFRNVRHATLSLFQDLPAAAWSRRGVASNHPITVRALAYVIAGHVAHHLTVLRERYA